MKYKIFLLPAVCCLLLVLATPVALAQFTPLQPDLMEEIFGTAQQAAGVGLGADLIAAVDIRVYALNLVRGALSVAGLIFVIFIMYGGVSWMAALKTGTGKEAVGSAKKILSRATIGMAIILSSYGITIMVSRAVQRAIFQNMLVQVQSCQTQTGPSTCCQEWTAFQNAVTSIPGFGEGFSDEFERGSGRSDELYGRWQECHRRESERAGLPSNLFD